MKTTIIAAVAAFLLLLAPSPAVTPAAAEAGARVERVQFAKGASASVIKGRISGEQSIDYQLQAGAGQTLSVRLESSNPQNYFNINPPGSDVAMFIGSTSGNTFQGLLPTDGDYTVSVYLMRAAARRDETAAYTLSIGVTGTPLAALPAAADALVPGTTFHASATISCTPAFEPNAQQCEAGVIRRGTDGTATVAIRPGSTAAPRRILFVKGEPVASDSPQPLAFTRAGDETTVTIGADERYQIPDALITGG